MSIIPQFKKKKEKEEKKDITPATPFCFKILEITKL